MVSELITYLEWGLFQPHKGCLSVWPCNPMRHNKDIVSVMWVFVMPHIGYGRNFLTLHMQTLFLTLQMRFKVVRVIWAQNGQYLHSWVRVVTNGIRVDPRPRYGGLFGSVRDVCLFGPVISWNTMRTLCLHGEGRKGERGGVFVTSYIKQWRKFLTLYMQRLLLTKQMCFKAMRAFWAQSR